MTDWSNEYKLAYSVESYFFRYDNYQKYLKTGNDFILKSAFGNKQERHILKEIDWWYNTCIGAYNKISFNKEKSMSNTNQT